jgi:SAM-dependent methyltransferase
MDAKTEELRAAHDVLAEFYAARLAGALDRRPEERAVLGLFCDLVLEAGLGTSAGDIGCGTGRLDPYLAARGLSPRGTDLSPEMIRVARRDQPGFEYDVADLRSLPFADASLAGIVCWLSPDEMGRRAGDAGFATVLWGGIPAENPDASAPGYLLARRT